MSEVIMMGNRTFSWMSPKLEVRNTRKYGRGIFAKRKIDKGELVIAYGGHVMTTEEFYKLPEDLIHFPSQIHDNLFLGLKKVEECEDAYFLNHSCNPNLGIKGQIFMVALRNIEKDEELTFDYGMEWYPEKIDLPGDKKRFDRMTCHCGSEICRGVVTENDWEIPELRKKYDGYFQWFIQEKINKSKQK